MEPGFGIVAIIVGKITSQIGKFSGGSAVKKPEFTLDIADERLWKNDCPVPITNKAFQMLKLFAEKPMRLVSKEEMLDAIWGDVYVTEGLIRDYVHDLRSALDDNPKTPRFIETVPRRGYRFLGGIVVKDARESNPAVNRKPTRPSVIVRSFKDLSGTERGKLLARGVSDDLVTDLARLPDVAVFSSPPNQLDDEFYELGGSVQLSDEMIRLNVRLARTGGYTIWSERYDRSIGDFLAVQVDLTARVASALGGTAGPLSIAERMRLSRRPPAAMEAWELYRLSFDLEIAFRREGTVRALSLAELAVKRDPDFARGWLVLGWVCWQMAMEGWCESSEAVKFRSRSLEAYERAATLDPLDAVAQMELSAVMAVRGHLAAARAALERALDLGRRQADLQISCANYVASILGEPERATHILDEALELLGLRTGMHNLTVLRVGVFNGDYERALEASLNAPDFLQTRLFRTLALEGSGRDTQKAVAEVQARVPQFDPRTYLDDHPVCGEGVTKKFLKLCQGAGLANKY